MKTQQNKKNVCNAIKFIGTSQSVKGQMFESGTGFVQTHPDETPFRIIDSRKVYHVSSNTFPVPYVPFKRTRDRKVAEIYFPEIILGSPCIGGDLHCYLQKAQGTLWVLWVHTRIDTWAFDGPFPQPLDPAIIAWCDLKKGDSREQIAEILVRAMLISTTYCDDGSLYNDSYKFNLGEYSFFAYKDEQRFLLCTVIQSVHRSQKDLDFYASLCPPRFLEHFLHQAVINPDAHTDDCFILNNSISCC